MVISGTWGRHPPSSCGRRAAPCSPACRHSLAGHTAHCEEVWGETVGDTPTPHSPLVMSPELGNLEDIPTQRALDPLLDCLKTQDVTRAILLALTCSPEGRLCLFFDPPELASLSVLFLLPLTSWASTLATTLPRPLEVAALMARNAFFLPPPSMLSGQNSSSTWWRRSSTSCPGSEVKTLGVRGSLRAGQSSGDT